MENFITTKIKYEFKNPQDELKFNKLWKDYNSLRNFFYNRLVDEFLKSGKTLSRNSLYSNYFQKKKLNNINLDSWFYLSAITEAISCFNKSLDNYKKKQEKVKKYCLGKKKRKQKEKDKLNYCKPNFKPYCFGGKKLAKQVQKGLISKEEFLVKKLTPLSMDGDKNSKCNRKFRLISFSTCIFQPSSDCKMELKIIIPKTYLNDFNKLIWLQSLPQKDERCIPISFKMNNEYLFVTYDLNKIREFEDYKPIQNRIFSFDNNPEHIGCTVTDWKGELDYKLVSAFDYSLEDLNEYDNSLKGKGLSTESKERKYVSDKRNFEIEQLAIHLVKKAKHFRCEYFAVEELSFEKEDLGSHYKNRLCRNQWLYRKLLRLIEKHCKLQGIKYREVPANYTSFLGNLIFQEEKLPDYCLASLEISRRNNEYVQQYIKKTKIEEKNIIFPKLDLVRGRISNALEVIGYKEDWNSLIGLYSSIKKSELKYRFPLESCIHKVFRLFHKNSYINFYNFL